MPFTCSDIFKLFFAILLPPLGVFLEIGLETPFWINILLTILGYIPVSRDSLAVPSIERKSRILLNVALAGYHPCLLHHLHALAGG
ncbi:hypothetical protein M427DRAFT_59411 [Gonapodya prolifera JEL478]|uniref:Uncharacterized protein n=1 Tax=Gonapodya prolifera (strain JEL478) TaxID=1344416 RepID=A0A139A749_GONPJ|nr:hypothetical protein M427DRAFT_59411 [Gonapodya prolifera JEL478]|eukprot:KXS12478.1 hypothetical protein M427DRAFT_59411 [Gonapodya prolifera JEL478]